MSLQNSTQVKLDQLKHNLKQLKSALVAFSGGVDSTLLLRIASEVLREKAIAVTVTSELYFPFELIEAQSFTRQLSLKHIQLENKALTDAEFRGNTPERCYWCKKAMFIELKKLARQQGIDHIIDGTNWDDLDDYRPGLKALEELGIMSPLKEAEFTKADIREVSKALDLPTWNKPALACLASRFPYGTRITSERLNQVRQAEEFLRIQGFGQFRVRHHQDTARIELSPEEMRQLFPENIRQQVVVYFKQLGYTYVTMDLEGYRTGSLNEILK